MSADPNKKSARTFQCRDVLWETFEQMAHELECSVDYLVNEAMKQYARQRSYGGTRTPYPAPTRDAPPSGDRLSGPPPMHGGGAITNRAPPPPGGALPPPPGRLPPPPGRPAPLPPPPGRGSLPAPPGRGPSHAPPAVSRSVPPPPVGPRTLPPPLPRGPTPVPVANGYPPAAAPQAAALTLIYQGERHTVNKDRFVIGRGKQSSDLTLKDPNVSRQHAMIEFQNGVYFMVDMGSTNGVEYNGQRVARKQIAEGDVYRICDHEIFFTYR
jgi:hypothetical protein